MHVPRDICPSKPPPSDSRRPVGVLCTLQWPLDTGHKATTCFTGLRYSDGPYSACWGVRFAGSCPYCAVLKSSLLWTPSYLFATHPCRPNNNLVNGPKSYQGAQIFAPSRSQACDTILSILGQLRWQCGHRTKARHRLEAHCMGQRPALKITLKH